MSVDVFLDTNVLLYAASGSVAEREKSHKARSLMRSEKFGVSTQVLQEFFHNATTKVRTRMSREAAWAWLEGLASRPCAIVDWEIIRLGVAISTRHQISYWDGAILAAAEALGAETLYTEDLIHGQVYGSVTAVNPFEPA